MLRMTCALIFLTVAPALAQDYTILAISHTDNKVSEVDPLTGETLREFVVPGEWFGETHEGAVSPDGRTIYVSVPYAKKVVILDLDTFEERGVIESEYFSRPPQVRGFARIGRRESTSSDPHGVALNRDGSKLYITVEHAEVPGIVVYDVEAGTVKKIDTVIAGNYLWVHPRTDKLYFPTRDDRVVVIDTKTDRIVQVIQLHEGSRPNGVDFGGPNDEVWVNGDGDGSVTVIDSATDEVIAVVQPRISGAGRVAVSPDGRFAAATQGPEVSIIDTRSKEILASLRISPNETGHGFPLFSPDSNTLHVMNELSGDMVTFDMRTLRQVGTRTPIGGAVFGGGIRVAPVAAQSNPYRQVEAPMPPAHLNGGEWGEMIQVHLGPEGNVFVLHRCFKVVLGDPGVAPGHSDGLSADCFGRWASHPPILKFAPSGEFLESFGVGMFGRPHGFAVDHEGNMWVTDVGLVPDQMGAVVVKLSPDGEVLMTLGTPGVTGQGRDTFNRPSGVAVAPNGEIYVTDGEGPNNRVVKFSREGRFIMAWGTTGPEPGNFSTPHDIAIDSRGRVFVADRGNSRVQIFDQDGAFLDQWSNFGRPSGIYINRETDVLYVTDSQSNSRNNPGFQRGIYIGSAITGEVTYFIPDPDLANAGWTRISGASGVAANASDTIVYAADVAPRQLRKYIRP